MTPQDIDAIAKAIAERMLSAQAERLWTPDDVAEYLSVCRRQVVDRYAKHPEFPEPLQLPTATGRGELRWPRATIKSWAESGGLDRMRRRAA